MKTGTMRSTLTLALICSVAYAHCQVSNGGFEDLTSNDLPAYWVGDLHLINITVDSNGVFHTDSVVFDGGSDYALSTDAHSGQYAMELRNGYNYTTDEAYVGRLHANSDTDSYGGFQLVTVPVQQRPLSISFWAKYAPLNNDSAYVAISVLDEAENEIGHGELTIGGPVTGYTAFELPITYTTEDVAAFSQISFATATPDGTASLGTRLLIDDVTVTAAPDGIADRFLSMGAVDVFPVPAHDRCTVRMADGSPVLAVNVFSVDGRFCTTPELQSGSFGTDGLAAGDYLLAVRTPAGTARTRLVVVH